VLLISVAFNFDFICFYLSFNSVFRLEIGFKLQVTRKKDLVVVVLVYH